MFVSKVGGLDIGRDGRFFSSEVALYRIPVARRRCHQCHAALVAKAFVLLRRKHFSQQHLSSEAFREKVLTRPRHKNIHKG